MNVDAPSGVRVEILTDLIHRCPYVDEVDTGMVAIGWTCVGGTLELHQLGEWLRTWDDVAITHEQLVESIREYLNAFPGIIAVTVEATFVTAGMTVTAGAP